MRATQKLHSCAISRGSGDYEVSAKSPHGGMNFFKIAKKSVDEESTAEYGFFYQLDWPPERVPPLIELVYFFILSIKEPPVAGRR